MKLSGRKPLYFLTILFILAVFSDCKKNDSKGNSPADLYKLVDNEIEQRDLYTEKKEKHLDSLRNTLNSVSGTRQKLALSNQLINEYEAFISDSALAYISRSQQLASELGDTKEYTRLEIKKADVASHAGLFSEAHAMLRNLDRASLDSTLLADYYAAYCSLYQYETEYLPEGEYSYRTGNLRDIYTDSLVRISKQDSFDYIINWASKQINQGNRDAAKKMLEENLSKYKPGSRYYSILASILAYLHKTEGNSDEHHRYLALTVISDLKGAVKENMAIRELATEVFEDGDIDRANRYLKVSFDDANFYSARMRNAQSSQMLPIIDKAYDTRQHSLQRRLAISLGLISILFLAVMAGVLKIYSQMKRISEANKKIGKKNEELSVMSERLKEMNLQLANSNQTTQEYAGLFMEYCSLNINDLQKYHTALRKLAVQGNVKGILKKLDASDVASETLKTFYSKFDEAILNIYPAFVDKVNSLLRPDSRIQLKSGEKLNTELRIIALMRIGINDSDKIAEFLRCSLATVYTYKSKIKKKAINPDEFEREIMTI